MRKDISSIAFFHSVQNYFSVYVLRKNIKIKICGAIIFPLPIPVAVRPKAWVFGRSLTRIVGSNTTGGIDVCLL
jgi:hypothetical protein